MKHFLILITTVLISSGTFSQQYYDAVYLHNDTVILGRALNFLGDIEIELQNGDTILAEEEEVRYIVMDYTDEYVSELFITATKRTYTAYGIVIIASVGMLAVPAELLGVFAVGSTLLAVFFQMSAWNQFQKVGYGMKIDRAIMMGRIWKE